MSKRRLMVLGALLSMLAVPPSPTAGQQEGTASRAAPQPKTPWGDPDLQGIWSPGYYLTPLLRPERYGTRAFLTDAEIAELERDAASSLGRNARLESAFEDLAGAYNDAFSGRGTKVIRTKRTSLIIDPPDGRIPLKAVPPPPRPTATAAPRRTVSYGVDADDAALVARTGGFDGPEDRRNDRCLGVTLPFIGGTSGTFSRMVQTPRALTMYYEDGHTGGVYRTVPIDGRPHLPPTVQQRLGHSVARWDGDTLVVDTTNFTNQTSFYGAREHLHLIERYTRTAPDLLMYQVTIEDPSVFSRPWTIELPLTRIEEKANAIYEAACHEGNHSMVGILAGARALEKEQAGRRQR